MSGDSHKPINIPNDLEGLTIEYCKDIDKLTKYLTGLEKLSEEYTPEYVYVTIGSKRPPEPLTSDDTTNSEYQVIPGFFDTYDKNAFIIMLDSFRKEEADDISEYTNQTDIIKSRYVSIKSQNPRFSLRIIMCNFNLTFDYNDKRGESGKTLHEEFVESYTNFGKFIYSIANYTYVKLELKNNRFLLCNYIRFKHPNPLETFVYYNSNSMIHWVLGGTPPKTGYTSVSSNFSSILPHFEQLTVEGKPVIERHYIWAGYAMLNIIHKYIDDQFINNLIYGFPPPSSKHTEFEEYNQFIKNDLKNIRYGDYSLCRYIIKSKTWQKVFSTFEMVVGGKKIEKNFKLIDITCDYVYFIEHGHFPNICEEV